MKRLLISSLSGGVGASTVTANLAAALQELGQRCLTVDMDAANTLRLHYGVDPLASGGWAPQLLAGEPLASAAFESVAGGLILPHGYLALEELASLEAQFGRDAASLLALLQAVENVDYLLIDLPHYRWRCPGGPWQQLLQDAELQLCVINPDPVSYSLLRLHPGWRQRARQPRSLLLSRLAPEQSLASDMLITLQREFDEQLVPLHIHEDLAAPEAMASLASLLQSAPQSQTAADFRALALWCVNELRSEK